jgi:hypothetical protein
MGTGNDVTMNSARLTLVKRDLCGIAVARVMGAMLQRDDLLACHGPRQRRSTTSPDRPPL